MHYTYGYYYCMNYGLMEQEPCQLLDCGVEKRENEIYDFNNETREEFGGYLFQYTMEGCGCFESGGEKIALEKGKAFLVPCPSKSRYYLEEGEGMWEFFFIHMQGPTVEALCKEINKRTGAVMRLEPTAVAPSCFFKEFESMQQGKQYQRYEVGEWLYHFLITLLRDVETPHQGDSACVDQALDWMQRNYSKQQNLSDMCTEIGVTLSHLTRQFHREQGITPEQYLMNLRLQQAVNLLVNTTLCVGVVAVRCGFSCGNYFAKVFRKKFHMSPTEYREYYCNRGILI